MKTRLFLSILAFGALTVFASAQTTDQYSSPAAKGRGHGVNWVDANNNGVCDNLESGTRMGKGQQMGKGNKNHRGQGKGIGRGNKQGANFVDENKNGVCDYRETPAKSK